jgi:hypothetical protein
MRIACRMGCVMIVRFELDLALGCSVIRLARHDGGRSCCGVCVDKRRSSGSEQIKSG